MNNCIKDFILNFIKKDKIKNSILFGLLNLILFIMLALGLTLAFNSLLGIENFEILDFFKKNNTFSKTISLTIVSILYVAFYFRVFIIKDNSNNHLGTAKIGGVSSLEGLTGDDGLLLSKKVQLAEKTCFEHLAIIGPTGSGKSSTFFIPNLLNIPAKASIVISDPKGELYRKTAAYNESIGRKCILFAPLEPCHSERYNPLDIAADVTDIREMAQNLLINGANSVALATGKSGGGDSEWINMSVPLWTAALLFCKEAGGEIGNIGSALDLLLEKDAEELDIIFSHSSDAVKKQYNIFKQASGSEKTVSSIKTVLSSNLQLFTDEKIRHITCQGTDFYPELLKDEPTAIYIMCPENKSSYASPFMSLFYSQLINRVMEYKGADLPVYMLLDEFANIGIIPNFAQIAATCRSRKLSLTVGIQGIEQLWQNYGKETGDNILNNLKAKMFYPGLAITTASVASQLCGFTTVVTESKSKDKNRKDQGSSTSMQRRELLDADEIRRLNGDELLLILHNREPIIDKQNRYYESPLFMKRLSEVELPIKAGFEDKSFKYESNYKK